MSQALTLLTEDDIRRILREELNACLAEVKPEQKPDEVLQGAQAIADFIGKKTSTVYRLVSERQIPCSKKSGSLYASKRDLQEWKLSGRKVTQTEAAEIATSRTGLH
jgi:hypothetical protein